MQIQFGNAFWCALEKGFLKQFYWFTQVKGSSLPGNLSKFLIEFRTEAEFYFLFNKLLLQYLNENIFRPPTAAAAEQTAES